MTLKRKLGDIGKQRRLKRHRKEVCEVRGESFGIDLREINSVKHELEHSRDNTVLERGRSSEALREGLHSTRIDSLNTGFDSVKNTAKPEPNGNALYHNDFLLPNTGLKRQESRSATNKRGEGLRRTEEKITEGDTIKRGDSGYTSGSDDESDVFVAVTVDCRIVPKPSDSIDGNCSWSRHSDSSPIENQLFRYGQRGPRRSASYRSGILAGFQTNSKPDHVSEVYIKHSQATDNATLGDRFGAALKTYRWKKGDKSYCQHFLTDVIKGDSPAHSMKIEDWDELVLINDVFVPDACHSDVLHIFSKVKVDAHTRLNLILRRPDKNAHDNNGHDENGQQKEWKWYQTSAILIPELDKEPRVKELEYGPVNNWYDHREWVRLHVWNDSLYLTVTQHDVTVDKLVSHDDRDPRDNCRKICAWSKVLADPNTGLLDRYVISIFGYHTAHDPAPYVAICGVESGIEMKDVAVLPSGDAPDPGDAVVSKDRAFWFDYKTNGEEMYITYNDKYLGYDRTSGNVGLHSEKQYLVLRGTDTPCSSIQSLASLSGSCDFTDGSNSSSATPESSMELDSSIASGITDYDSPMSSEESNSSGYGTPSSPRETNKRITRSMSRQHTVSTPLSNLSLE